MSLIMLEYRNSTEQEEGQTDTVLEQGYQQERTLKQ